MSFEAGCRDAECPVQTVQTPVCGFGFWEGSVAFSVCALCAATCALDDADMSARAHRAPAPLHAALWGVRGRAEPVSGPLGFILSYARAFGNGMVNSPALARRVAAFARSSQGSAVLHHPVLGFWVLCLVAWGEELAHLGSHEVTVWVVFCSGVNHVSH